ncbi:MAG TPA: electron transfer flavoprotein subunit alpha/FixB family protein [Dehalococcoidia bacterium]|nr:electron transfer flavoprotein subunit alpha/FixB family protein [Dehalococcoidia bacterium]
MEDKGYKNPQDLTPNSSRETGESKGVWFIAEHKTGQLEKTAFLLAGEGRALSTKLGEELAAVIIGNEVKHLADQLGPYGVENAFIIEDELLEEYTGDAYVNVLSHLVKSNQPSLVLFPTTPMGNDLAPRLAARLRVGLVTHYTEIEVDREKKLTIRRPIHGGKASATVMPLSKPLIATIDPQLLTVQKAPQAKNIQVIETGIKVDPKSIKTRFIDYMKADPCAVCVSEAEIVIGVGKGLGCADNLKAVEELARILGASIGGSRRATDERWISDERRIGLTGKTIAPKLYLICGISGAFHHTLSIKSSQLMIAINKDKNAPIAKLADMVIVGDMQQIIPELAKQLKEALK